jgi:S-DNA-T family DNA segregation ATPase FtsK/SpoIIIE
MILEGAALTACVLYLYKNLDKERRDLRKTWIKIMKENSLLNDDEITYTLAKINPTEYGFLCIVAIPPGFSFEELEAKKEILQSGLKGIVTLEHNIFNGWITMKIYRNPLKDLTFAPEATKPHELYLGYTFDKHIVVNMHTHPHVLYSGINGSGKTRALYCLMTNLIHNHSKEEINIYMSQIGKTDLFLYRECPQVIEFAKTPEQSLRMYKTIHAIVKEREMLIEKMMPKGILNIEDYNNIMPVKLPIVYVVSDEFSLYMPDATDTKDQKAMKEQCLDLLGYIIKIGRGYGVFVLMCLQRTTKDQMPMFLKSQVNTKLTFKQTDVHSSRNVIDTDEALKLRNREGILLADDKYMIKTPYIDQTIIQKYLKEAAKAKPKPIVIDAKTRTYVKEQQDGIIRGA